MNVASLGDPFYIIEGDLAPIDLYRLSQTCKDFNNAITEERIKNSIVIGIKKRFNFIFGERSEKLMCALKMNGAMVIGSLIAQVMLGEIWSEDNVDICVTRSSNEKDEALGTIGNIRYPHGETRISDTEFSTGIYNITEFDVFIHLFERKSFSDDVDVFMRFEGQYIYENSYNFGSDELQIDSMYDIFERRANLQHDDVDLGNDFFKIYRRGFKFYHSREDKRILSDEEILSHMYNVIRVQKNTYRKDFGDSITTTIYNNVMHFEDDIFLPVHVAEQHGPLQNDDTLIYACNERECCATMLGINRYHFHYDTELENAHSEKYIIVPE